MNIIAFFIENPNTYFAVIVILSLFIGSFLNVVIHRLPIILEARWSEECRLYLGLKPNNHPCQSLALPASYCPNCQRSIRPWHNIPVISYLLLRGKCAYCQESIAIRYPLVEIITAIMSLYVAISFGVSLQTLFALFFTWIIIALTFIDLEHFLLPDELTLLLLWLGLISSIFNIFCSPNDAIIGAVCGYLIFLIVKWLFKKMTHKDGMGQGDVKFLAALGAYCGFQLLPVIILLSAATGILFTVSHMIVKNNYKSEPLPFGPYLALAGWCALLVGNDIMRYYYLKMG